MLALPINSRILFWKHVFLFSCSDICLHTLYSNSCIPLFGKLAFLFFKQTYLQYLYVFKFPHLLLENLYPFSQKWHTYSIFKFSHPFLENLHPLLPPLSCIHYIINLASRFWKLASFFFLSVTCLQCVQILASRSFWKTCPPFYRPNDIHMCSNSGMPCWKTRFLFFQHWVNYLCSKFSHPFLENSHPFCHQWHT